MTTIQTALSKRLEQETQFLQAIRDRIKNNNGAKADFKRALSGEENHIRKVYPILLPLCIGNLANTEWEQKRLEKQIWIPVACFSVFYPQPIQEDAKHRNFGHSCRTLADKTESKGAERRFKALLDLALADMPSQLAALVRQMKTKGVVINYPQLLADLCRWEHSDQYIQDKWARAFWGAPQPDTNHSDNAS
jgi:CRISPR system Cascade subunit CasB